MCLQERPIPKAGMLMVETARGGRVGEFRGLAGPYWSLRPICGGAEWEATPDGLREATPAERMQAQTARQKVHGRGEFL
ncbi:hypothetical protein [Streptomyces sp. 4R-3d]|uniref:hypothetical protein n=1 Tax=Streptomyces sp. 4R-3d TaxID=2559605 RepID=UPI001071B03A|nr:hypothetical protein [Streptomyces sp. 4R-3d]TFI25541.1 hypothetical protein E4P36_19055 [Streptomyces sp. 4R-3d]